ncbi:GNAT family N-acetyltransferase [Jeotgalibaca sp. MA1X17-3]|uniref:GNAT family N-acetyltransferase n=1 Tax=Jeotgalibaca sp. MA1X17-3 TaxID=2908211 RepID=UPI001F3AA43C|nr:GNAT family N-acetyltransferase [Jeotgalibaca sp. MA1X17-3]UJF15393.1 GNAT family N-acetyltransferase [Jeotgalibaca sp. MA1X17-3]
MKQINKNSINLSFDKNASSQELKDIYLTKVYAKLFEEKEEGEVRVFDFVSPYGKVKNIFIKRKIPYKIKGQEYYDITTAYGYGGPVVLETTNVTQLLKEYFEAFHQYCIQEQIISEFVRFHLFDNEEIWKQFNGEVQLIGPHIVRDLKKNKEEDFHKSILQSVRRAERLEVEIVFDPTGKYLDEFLEVYTATMDWHDAKGFYYFDKSFFEQIHETMDGHYLYVHARLGGKIIGTRLILFGDQYAYYFLGGALREYSTYKAASYLDYEIINYLKQAGKEYYIFGGGYRGEDSLYQYKTKFSQQGQVPFYIGKKTHLPEVYKQLTDMRSQQGNYEPDSLFYPLYRS